MRLSFFYLCFALAQSSGATGSLQGSVTDPQGLPLAGAVVRYQSVLPPVTARIGSALSPVANVVSGSVITDANGNSIMLQGGGITLQAANGGGKVELTDAEVNINDGNLEVQVGP